VNRAAVPSAVAAGFVCTVAWAQAAEDPMARMRSCSLMETAQRVECLDNAALAIAPPRAPSGGWTVGLTTSPVDYSPIATASVAGRADAVDSAATALRLTIRCRGGRTEMTVEGAGIVRGDQVISYQINGGPAVRVGTVSRPSGSGVALGGDAVRLVQSLPDGGSLAVQLQAPGRVAAEATFPLDGLDAVRQRLASVCRWPHAAAAKPGD
jgi:hypothetical protein